MRGNGFDGHVRDNARIHRRAHPVQACEGGALYVVSDETINPTVRTVHAIERQRLRRGLQGGAQRPRVAAPA